MSAVGVILIGFGLLTAWAGFDRVIVFDVLRTFISAPVEQRTDTGASKAPTTKTA